jgi:GNAT superfamily N-acetyltransferase
MKNTLCLTITIVLLWASPDVHAMHDQDTAAIDAFIVRQARRERGEEYKDARKIAAGDLNHDGVADTAVLYTIEGQGGSNNHTQYLAVFVRGKAVANVAVGGKSYRSVELTSVSDNKIHLDTLDYAPKDAACCPSKKGTTEYALVGGVLREQKRRRDLQRRVSGAAAPSRGCMSANRRPDIRAPSVARREILASLGLSLLRRMAVAPDQRGKGYGDVLIQAAIAQARRRGVESIYLLSNTVLGAPISLYRKHGFQTVTEYARCNIVMELRL